MNNSVQSVRHRDTTTGRVEDRRVRRTTDALVDALIHLVVEKGYDAVTVQDLLDHADIGRSTFYAHYRGKDDLLTKSFERLLAMLGHSLEREHPPSPRVAPVRELFRHVREFGHFRRAVERDGMLHRTYKAGVDHMTSSIARRLEALGWVHPDAPTVVVARAHAGALFSLLEWWVEQDGPFTPEQMDEVYHRWVIGPGVRGERAASP